MKLLFFIPLVIISCKPSDSKDKIVAQDDKRNVYIILCDVTRSIDSINVSQRIAEHASKIYSSSPYNSYYYYYSIGDDDYNTLIYEGKKIDEVVPYSKKDQVERLHSDTIPLRIQEAVRDTYRKEPIYQKTCITMALLSAYKKIDEESKQEDANFKIIILSDMIEECDSSPCGFINMNGLVHKTNIEKTKNTLAKPPLSIIRNLAKFNVEICFVFESENRNYRLQERELEEYWKNILQHFGYSMDSHLIKFSNFQDLPIEFKK